MAKKSKAPKSSEKVIRETIDGLLETLGVAGKSEITVRNNGEEEEVELVLETPDSGVVIGYHGEVLEALQLVLSLSVSKKLGKFVRVTAEIGDYRKNRTDWLESLAQQAKERALSEQQEVSLPRLKSWERRIIHMLLQDDQEVSSESVGEGKDRTLVIKPR